MLREHHGEQTRRYAQLGIAHTSDCFVFDRLDARPWDPNEMSRQFSRLVRSKNLPPVRFHDLRHAFASLSFAAGAPLKIVSESLGHSAIGVTSAIYVHLLDDSKRDHADKLEAFLGAAVRALPGDIESRIAS